MIERTGISAVCFDFDGTLGMTGEELKNAWKQTIAYLNLNCPDFDTVYRIGPSLQDMSAKLFPDKTAEELSEIQRVSDRVIVMCEGRVTGELPIEEATSENIMKLSMEREGAV